MPPSVALIARNHRILAGHAARATVLDLALAEEVDHSVVRRVLRAGSVTVWGAAGPVRYSDGDRIAWPVGRTRLHSTPST